MRELVDSAIADFRQRTGRYGFTAPFIATALSRAQDIDIDEAFDNVEMIRANWSYCSDIDTYVCFGAGIYDGWSMRYTLSQAAIDHWRDLAVNGMYSKLHRSHEWVGDENVTSQKQMIRAVRVMKGLV